jgi:hypothetical protein
MHQKHEPDHQAEFIPTERIALVIYLLAQGHSFTIRQVAHKVGITTGGASLMLRKASRVIPLCEEKGVWSLVHPPD